MNESTRHHNRNASENDDLKEQDPGTDYFDPATEYVKGHSSDRRAVNNFFPETVSTHSIRYERWEH